MFKKLKEKLTACYDPMTDTIHNCKPDTNAWHHEDRHRQQMKGGVIPLCYTYHICFMTALITIFAFNSGNPLYMLFAVCMVALYLYPELDAIVYAHKMMRNKK